MTNAEKYLKDGADIEDLTDKFEDWHKTHSNVVSYGEALFRFLQVEVKPTLTEDEKVILRNIDTKNFYKIGRKDGYLYLKGDSCYGFEDGKDKEIFWYLYHNLFLFIQERRRI